MDFVEFKDIVFDLINECDRFEIKDIQCFDRENCYRIILENGKQIELRLNEAS